MTAVTADDTIGSSLQRVRRRIDRFSPDEAAERMTRGALLIDIRPLEFRKRDGEIPGAIAVSRHVLEWRLDVSSRWRLSALDGVIGDPEFLLLCNEGYTSSLAAYQVRELLGVSRIGDIIDGFMGWRAAGLPVVGRAIGRRARETRWSGTDAIGAGGDAR